VIWLGDKRGYLSDWVTQRWVRTTGRRVSLREHPWLDGPAGGTRGIGRQFFEEYAAAHNLEVLLEGTRGLIPSFSRLDEGNPKLEAVSARVREFYEKTSCFEMDAWSEWHGLFRPFGKALSLLFSRRLQQLNVPLSPLDSAKGMTSIVLQLKDALSGLVVQTAWVRELHSTKNVLYAGSYSVCKVPGHPTPCVKVVFPLPNGNAIVVMKAEAHDDGALLLKSGGKDFGDPGFYFVVHDGGGSAWARYVKSLREEIRVYAAEESVVRADHTLWLWGIRFLRLHYRMRMRNGTQSIDRVDRSAPVSIS
jgi:hypothetical protein